MAIIIFSTNLDANLASAGKKGHSAKIVRYFFAAPLPEFFVFLQSSTNFRDSRSSPSLWVSLLVVVSVVAADDYDGKNASENVDSFSVHGIVEAITESGPKRPSIVRNSPSSK